MGNPRPFADVRHLAFCAQCGGPPETRDHVPAKTFLDEPFPDDLSVVGTCSPCNGGASFDEEYVACLIEVGACGSTDPNDLERSRISRALARNPALAARFKDAYDQSTGAVAVEVDRVRRVIEKTARGLWAYELSEPALGMRADVRYQPIHTMDAEAQANFERIPDSRTFAEVGSRMMIRQALAATDAIGWQVVQPDRFRYAVQIEGEGMVKFVLRGYLAAEIRFTELPS